MTKLSPASTNCVRLTDSVYGGTTDLHHLVSLGHVVLAQHLILEKRSPQNVQLLCVTRQGFYKITGYIPDAVFSVLVTF